MPLALHGKSVLQAVHLAELVRVGLLVGDCGHVMTTSLTWESAWWTLH